MPSPLLKEPLKLVASVVICTLVGASGSVFTVVGPGSWYDQLAKPWFNPPSWLFGPVWTALYILMGVALYLIWMEGLEKPQVKAAILLFALQLLLNFLWSYMFFGLQSPLLALAEIAILWLVLLATIIAFFRIRRGAAYLLIPYILWVTFAAYLNYAIYILNPPL
jgi:benzodiazapine receptor